VLSAACQPLAAQPPRAQPSSSPGQSGLKATPTPSPTAAPVPTWQADPVPHTEDWASIIVVVDLVADQDPETARAEREAIADLMVSATDGTQVGVVRASSHSEILVHPVTMRDGREQAIQAIWWATSEGERDLHAAVVRAQALAGRSQADSVRRGVLVIASDVDDSLARLLAEPSLEDIHTVAIGVGPHEAALAGIAQQSGGLYFQAGSADELRQRVSDARRKLEGQSLVAAGVLQADAEGHASTPVAVGAGEIFARFTAWGVPSDSMTVTNPDGEHYRDGPDDEPRVSKFAGRVSLGAAAVGTWRLDLEGLRPGALVPFEVELFFEPFPEARAQADLDAREGLRIGYMDSDLPAVSTVTATLSGPAGPTTEGTPTAVPGPGAAERTVELGPSPVEDSKLCCLGDRRELHLDGPTAAGSYLVTVRSSGGSGETAFQRAVRFGFYMWPAVDSDGDGVRDRVEIRYGLDPDDPADGAFDHDFDGLTTAQELGELGTDPAQFDTDDGREGDGSEVRAGRDPLDAADDQPPPSCFPRDASTRFEYDPDAPRDPELEALLPDRVLGRPLTKSSIKGGPLLHPFHPGWIWQGFVFCTGRADADLSVAYATSAALGNLGVIAVRVDGVSGAELADIFMHRLSPGSEDDLHPTPVIVEGRRATVLQTGFLLYPHDDVLFMAMSLAFGDCFSDCGPPLVSMDRLAPALLPLLPGP
jgi:hypothetical protein